MPVQDLLWAPRLFGVLLTTLARSRFKLIHLRRCRTSAGWTSKVVHPAMAHRGEQKTSTQNNVDHLPGLPGHVKVQYDFQRSVPIASSLLRNVLDRGILQTLAGLVFKKDLQGALAIFCHATGGNKSPPDKKTCPLNKSTNNTTYVRPNSVRC